MKKALVIFATITMIILGAGAYVFFTYRQTAQNQQPAEQQAQEIIVEDKKITEEQNPLSIEVSHPFIAGADGFNAKVGALINAEIKNFKEMSLENDAAVKETDPQSYAQYPREYDLKISYETGEVSEKIVSILFSVYSFTGGAHGNGYFTAVNYNIKENKEIVLADMFPGQSNYLKKVSDYCLTDLTRQMTERMGSPESGWLQDGAGPNPENYQAFLIKPESITFYFAPYQVAAYAAGDFKVAMPR